MTFKPFRVETTFGLDLPLGDVDFVITRTPEMENTPMNLDLFDERTRQRFAELAREVQTARKTGANHGGVLSDAIRTMKRLNARQETLPAKVERVELVPQRGPRIEFVGRLLARDDWNTSGRDPMNVEFDIWETRGGALVAVSVSEPIERDGVEVVKVEVVERQDDAQAMRLAVMDFFDWHNRARSMARKLGWDLRVEVQ